MLKKVLTIITHQKLINVNRLQPSGCNGNICTCCIIFQHTTHERNVGLSDMFSKDELPILHDAYENQEGTALHSFSINDNVGLPGRVGTV